DEHRVAAPGEAGGPADRLLGLTVAPLAGEEAELAHGDLVLVPGEPLDRLLGDRLGADDAEVLIRQAGIVGGATRAPGVVERAAVGIGHVRLVDLDVPLARLPLPEPHQAAAVAVHQDPAVVGLLPLPVVAHQHRARPDGRPGLALRAIRAAPSV